MPTPIESGTAHELIRQAAALADWFVFGGGDPLMRTDIVELIQLASGEGLRVDLQTNAVLLGRDSAPRLMPLLQRLGLSLDGEDLETHAKMRGSRENFAHVINALEIAESFGIPTTIRTLVSRVNRGRLAGIADVIARFECIEKWSLREFTPLGRGAQTNSRYSLTRAEFLAECSSIQQQFTRRALTNTRLSIVTTKDMESCFCLISEEGFVYGHPVCGTYRAYGRFPDEPLSVIIQRLQHDATAQLEREEPGRLLSIRLAPSS